MDAIVCHEILAAIVCHAKMDAIVCHALMDAIVSHLQSYVTPITRGVTCIVMMTLQVSDIPT